MKNPKQPPPTTQPTIPIQKVIDTLKQFRKAQRETPNAQFLPFEEWLALASSKIHHDVFRAIISTSTRHFNALPTTQKDLFPPIFWKALSQTTQWCTGLFSTKEIVRIWSRVHNWMEIAQLQLANFSEDIEYEDEYEGYNCWNHECTINGCWFTRHDLEEPEVCFVYNLQKLDEKSLSTHHIQERFLSSFELDWLAPKTVSLWMIDELKAQMAAHFDEIFWEALERELLAVERKKERSAQLQELWGRQWESVLFEDPSP